MQWDARGFKKKIELIDYSCEGKSPPPPHFGGYLHTSKYVLAALRVSNGKV